jgi:hypothetical protein
MPPATPRVEALSEKLETRKRLSEPPEVADEGRIPPPVEKSVLSEEVAMVA